MPLFAIIKTMQTLQEETDYGVISTVHAESDEEIQALYLGGWKQNPDLMTGVQRAMAKVGISSVGISAFDTVPALAETAVNDESDPFLIDVPPRMLLRARILNKLSQVSLRETIEPSVVLTHCAGANVLLLAQYLNSTSEEGARQLPNKGILAEPMLLQREGLTARNYFMPFARHEKKAKQPDSGLISLSSLSPSTDAAISTSEGLQPLNDIANSRGATFLALALANGNDYRVVVGSDDCAANKDDLEACFEAASMDITILDYPDQRRTGHGYLLAEPDEAIAFIAPLLSQRQ